jgi:hypothetical protein
LKHTIANEKQIECGAIEISDTILREMLSAKITIGVLHLFQITIKSIDPEYGARISRGTPHRSLTSSAAG